MKSIKLFLLIAVAAAICSGSAFAGDDGKSCPDKKDHKCCAEAKKAGKACDKCPVKDDAKK